MVSVLGFGKRKLIQEIIKKTWKVEDPYEVKLGLNEILYIVQEIENEEGKAYLESGDEDNAKSFIYKEFVKYLLYRNIANYDSMLLLTSDKGCITGDALLETPRDLKKYPKGIPLKELAEKGPIYVYSFNRKTNKIELKKCDGVEFVKTCDIYELTLSNGETLKGTDDHPILTKNNTYKKLIDLTSKDYVITQDGLYKVKSVLYKGVDNVYDVVNVEDNHNFIANGFIISNSGKSSAAIILAREWCKLIGIKFDPNRHLAYSNQDVMDKIDILNSFEPLVCVTGDTKIKVRINGVETVKRIDELTDLNNYEVLSYNLKNKSFEYIKPEKTIEQKKKKKIYTIKLQNGKKLKVTAEHLILTKKGYKKVKDLSLDDEIKVYTEKCKLCKKDFIPRNSLNYVKIQSIKKGNSTKVFDIVNIPKNHNFVANNMVVHNCDEAVRFASTSDWAKSDSKILRKKLAQVRTKHLFFILCFPLKITKMEKTYLDSFVNYWCITGDTKINMKIDNKKQTMQVKDLIGTSAEVLSYNIKTKKKEYKKYENVILTKENETVYQVKLINGDLIKATKEHLFLTIHGWTKLNNLSTLDKIMTKSGKFVKVDSINKLNKREDVYDIVGVEDNHNFIANNMVVHNCDLFGRGQGALFVKDRNPVNDTWRMKDFKNVGSYTEFASLGSIEKRLMKHPNFWKIIKFPKPPQWLYNKYLKVRERNVYSEESVRSTVTSEDIYKSLLLLALQDVMMNDTTLNINRIALHIKNTYDMPIPKKQIQSILIDAKQLVNTIRSERIGGGSSSDT